MGLTPTTNEFYLCDGTKMVKARGGASDNDCVGHFEHSPHFSSLFLVVVRLSTNPYMVTLRLGLKDFEK